VKYKLLVIIGMLSLVGAACGGGDDDAATGADDGATATTAVSTASAADGQALYDATCTACHGEGGVGIEGLGLPLIANQFISGMDDGAVIEFIKVGRDAADPANTTGVAMPAKGGNPALSDADLASIVAYLRTLN
jgi:mono/diheme cytochrome c family protein